MTLSRRTFVAAASATVAMPTVLRAQARELVMIGYGTAQDDPIKRAGAELAKRHAGVSLRVIGGLSAEALAQIKAARGASPYDLAVMGTPAIINAVAEDVLEPIDTKKVPSFSKLDPKFPASARGMGVPVNYFRLRHRLQQADREDPADELGRPLEAGIRRQGGSRPAAVQPRPRCSLDRIARLRQAG